MRLTKRLIPKMFALVFIVHSNPSLGNAENVKNLNVNQDGLTIVADPTSNPLTTEMNKRLEKIDADTRALRSQILSTQDRLAQEQKDIVNVRIEANIQNKARGKALPIGFVELVAKINDVELVRYLQPPMTTENPSYPLYVGPIPVGTYQLTIRSIAGVLQHDWPYSLAQGRWNIEKTFALKIQRGATEKNVKILLKPGDLTPSLSIDEEGGPPK
jgi:hypothetical protein